MIANESLETRESIAPDVFSDLYEAHAVAALGLALRLTEDRALAEDAVQEAMLRVWRSAASLHFGNVRGWVLRIVARESLRLMKSRQREKKRAENATALRLVRIADSPCEIAERENAHVLLRSVMARLSVSERRLLSLHYEAGMSQRKMSAAIGAPQQSISYRLNHVMNRLRSELSA